MSHCNRLRATRLDRSRDTAGRPYINDIPGRNDSALIEFTLHPETGLAEPASYREVFRIENPQSNSNHSIMQVDFNPYSEPGGEDYGLLYVSMGDRVLNGNTVTSNVSQSSDLFGRMPERRRDLYRALDQPVFW